MIFVPYKDADRRRAYGREWIHNNAEKAREAMCRWRASHPAEHAAETRSYYARHKEQHKAFMTAYRLANPAVVRTKAHRRRARTIGAQGSFTTSEWLALLDAFGRRCGYCGESGALEVDHRVPLGRGGANSIDNIIPACRVCNARRHLLTEDEFR